MELILIRHGETEWNRIGKIQGVSDIGLNDKGLWQAGRLAENLKEVNIGAIYSSDLLRCRQTADSISEFHDINVTLKPSLREMDQGIFEGKFFEDIQKSHKELLRLWRESPEKVQLPEGETLAEVQDRMYSTLEEFKERHKGEVVVAVSHHFAISTLLCRVMSLSLKEFASFKLKQACKTRIVYNGDSFTVNEINDVSHLED